MPGAEKLPLSPTVLTGLRDLMLTSSPLGHPTSQKELEEGINGHGQRDAPLGVFQLICRQSPFELGIPSFLPHIFALTPLVPASTFKLMVTREMLALSVLIMFSGMELTFWSAKYPTMLNDAFEPRVESAMI